MGGKKMGFSVQAVERSLQRAAAVWGAAWILNLASAFAAHTSISVFPWASATAIAVSAIAWLLAVLAALPKQAFILSLAGSAIAQFALINASEIPEAYLYLTAAANSVMVLAGMLLSAQRARLLMTLFVPVVAAILVAHTVDVQEWNSHWRYIVVVVFYALADAAAVTFASSVLRAAAENSDREVARASQFWVQRHRDVAARDVHDRISGLLHDTLINTLSAIRRGVAAESIPLLRRRCASDLERIEVFRKGSVELRGMSVAELARRCEATAEPLGLRCHIQHPNSGIEASAQAADVLSAALSEVLLNVSKHAGTIDVDVIFDRSPSRDGWLRVTVRDQGRGWPKNATKRGFARFVDARLAAISGDVQVESPSTGGTEVILELPLAPLPSRAGEAAHLDLEPPIPVALPKAAVLSGSCMAALGAVQTAVAWRRHEFGGSLAALCLLAAALIVLPRLAQARGMLPSAAQWMLVPVMAGIVAFPQAGTPGSDISAVNAWGPDGAAGLMLLMILLDRGWGPLAAAATGLVLGLVWPLLSGSATVESNGGPIATTMVIELGTAAVIHMFRRLTETLYERSRQEWDTALQEAAMREADEMRVRAITSRLDSAVQHAGWLLRDIGSGQLNPTAAEAVSAAAAGELTLRGLLAIEPEHGKLGELIATHLLRSTSAGLRATVQTLDPAATAGADQVARLDVVLSRITGGCSSGTEILYSIFTQGSISTLSVVFRPSWMPSANALISALASSDMDISLEDFSSETLVQVSWGSHGN